MAEPPTADERVLAVLRASGVFGSLEEPVLQDLGRFLHLQTIPGGAVVLREGEPADTMFFLVSGRLRVSRRDAQGVLQLYNEIRPGESVGEAGLILQQARAADITALRDSTLAMLGRADFERLLVLHPLALNKVFAQAIFNHLRHASQAVERRHAQIFVVVPLDAGTAAHEVAQGLTRACAVFGRAYQVPPDAQSMVDPSATGAWSGKDRYDDLEEQYDFLIYEADPRSLSWAKRAFRQADQVVFVARHDGPAVAGELEQLLAREPGFEMKRKHLVVLHPADADMPAGLMHWRDGRDVERVYPIRSRHVGDYARLARFLHGKAVGVVLGGGGARGFAHLGVLRALEQAGIVVDMVGGNSMGALLGAQYACGWPLDEIRDRTVRFARGGERPTLPVISIVSGRRVERDLRRTDCRPVVAAVFCHRLQPEPGLHHGAGQRAVVARSAGQQFTGRAVPAGAAQGRPAGGRRDPGERAGGGHACAPGNAAGKAARQWHRHCDRCRRARLHGRGSGIAPLVGAADDPGVFPPRRAGISRHRRHPVPGQPYRRPAPARADHGPGRPLSRAARGVVRADGLRARGEDRRGRIPVCHAGNRAMDTAGDARLTAGSLPLSLSQLEVWRDQRAWPGSAHLNLGGTAFFEGPLDLPRLRRALSQLVAENAALRLVLQPDGTQRLLPAFEPELRLIDMSAEPEPRQAMRQWWQHWMRQPFALHDGTPPWRFALLRASDVLHGGTIQFHHLIMDGWGTTQVMKRWSAIYNRIGAGDDGVAPSDDSYLAFVAESHAYRQSESFARDAVFWRAQLPALPEPLLQRRQAHARDGGLPDAHLVVESLPRADYDRLERLAAGQGITPFNFFLAALALYFARVGEREQVLVGATATPWACSWASWAST